MFMLPHLMLKTIEIALNVDAEFSSCSQNESKLHKILKVAHKIPPKGCTEHTWADTDLRYTKRHINAQGNRCHCKHGNKRLAEEEDAEAGDGNSGE